MVRIYALRNTANGYCYIGSTKGKLSKRMREHRCLLNGGKHKTPKLQQDWFKFGQDAFRCELLAVVSDDLSERRKSEISWMATMEQQGLLYNEHMVSMAPTQDAIRKGVANSHNEPGNRWTEEANLKRSLAQKGIPKGHGAKISATKRARNAMR